MFPAYGLPEERRVARFVEGIRIMKALWQEESVDFEGSFATLSGVKMEPKPVQKPHPPLWFGARAPDALRRTARLADGWMGAGSSTNEAFIRERGELMQMLEEEGRDPATFGVTKRVYLAIDSDEARGWAGLREWIGGFYGNPDLAEQWSIVGSAEYVAERAVGAGGGRRRAPDAQPCPQLHGAPGGHCGGGCSADLGVPPS